MKEVKSPKKPLIYYYVIVLLVLAAFNFFVSPLLLSRQVTEVDYGTFMSMTEKKNIGRVEVEDSQIIFTDKNNDNIYKTGVMDDPNLTERLYQSGATFSKDIEQTMSPIMSFLLTFILPMVIFVVLGQYLGRKLLEQAGGKNSMAFGMGKSNARVYVQSTEGIHFDDVAGEDEAKENLAEIVDYLHNPKKYTDAGASMPKGLLLVGPPGTGKTMLAKAVAGESGVPFFSISGSEFVEMFVGMGASKVRDLFKQAKEKGEKLTMLTAYDYSTAKLIDEAGINAILVGDSLGMVVLGYEDTLSVTMEDMIHHSAAVSRGIKDTLLITDMPFMSYQTSVYDAVVNAGRLVKEGHAQAVKLEGGREVCPQIKAIVDASIPVCAHLGLTPQSVNAFGGFKVQGKGEEAAQKLLDEARAVEEAGAFAVVLECVPKALAKKITESISIPTIGIGAGADCDGQVLVYQDMLAMYANMKPKFVKQFAQVGKEMNEAFTAYKKAVEEGSFPGEEHTFKMDETIIDKLY